VCQSSPPHAAHVHRGAPGTADLSIYSSIYLCIGVRPEQQFGTCWAWIDR
jgi:hypothetical protein